MVDHEQTQSPGMGTIHGRVALVTGGTRGIGAAICQLLAEQGAEVAAGYWRHPDSAEKFLSAITADYPGRTVTLHEGNIGSAEDCRRVINEVIDQHGRLDILVNNARITIDRTARHMPAPDSKIARTITPSRAIS